jgi:hypothetical protein
VSEFELEDDIPAPDDDEDKIVIAPEPEIEDVPDPRWQPFIWHATDRYKRKCTNNAHRPAIGKCVLCGDEFPCPSGNCGHADCADPSLAGLDCLGNGTETPEWLQVGK